MISITLHTATTATVTHRPDLLARLLLGQRERSYDVQRIRDVGGYAWIDSDNRAVSRRIAELIEGAETMRALGMRAVAALRRDR